MYGIVTVGTDPTDVPFGLCLSDLPTVYMVLDQGYFGFADGTFLFSRAMELALSILCHSILSMI